MSTLVLVLAAGMTVPGDVPEKVSGEMKDEVVHLIACFRSATNQEQRCSLARRLGPIRDPRVTVALMEAVLREQSESRLLMEASSMLVRYHIPEEELQGPTKTWTACRLWWEDNEVDVRRRARQLP